MTFAGPGLRVSGTRTISQMIRSCIIIVKKTFDIQLIFQPGRSQAISDPEFFAQDLLSNVVATRLKVAEEMSEAQAVINAATSSGLFSA